MRLALGTAQFGMPYGIANRTGKVPAPVVADMLRVAAAHGIDTLDTAVAYGDSEQSLGAHDLSSFKLVTKLPAISTQRENIAAWVRDQVSGSLGRLGQDRLHAVLLHHPDDFLGPAGQEVFSSLARLRDEGKVSKLGISIYSPSILGSVLDRFSLDIVQAPLNLVDRRLETSGWLSRLNSLGIEVHSRSSFLQGLLLMDESTLPPKFGRWNPLWSRWWEWLRVHSVSPLAVCLAYPLSLEGVHRVVVGADGIDHLQQIIDLTTAGQPIEFPDLASGDEDLINPSRWATL